MRYYSSTASATTLAASCSDTASSIDLSSTTGLPSQYPYTLVLDVGTMSEEIVTVTGLSGLTAAVIRGEDGSAAQSHQTGAAVRHMASARDFREPQQHMAATVAHGASSNLVGVSDTQTLSNKTLDGSTQLVLGGTPVALTSVVNAGTFAHIRYTGSEADSTGATWIVPNAAGWSVVEDSTGASMTSTAGVIAIPSNGVYQLGANYYNGNDTAGGMVSERRLGFAIGNTIVGVAQMLNGNATNSGGVSATVLRRMVAGDLVSLQFMAFFDVGGFAPIPQVNLTAFKVRD